MMTSQKSNSITPTHPSVFAVFPGQGSQFVGMGKDVFENFSIARETFEEASDAIRADLKKLCFDGPESDLVLTENTQPCLLTTSVAVYRVVEKEFGFVPGGMAGHSLGEYSALVSAKSLGLAQAVRWVRERGLAMQRAVPAGEGTMAAVLGLDDALVSTLCEKATSLASEKRKSNPESKLSVPAVVEPANFNAPGQVVIAGSSDAVQEAVVLIKEDSTFKGGKAIPLQVSAPFHCRLMKPARERMAELFSQSAPAVKPQSPYIPNRTARLSQEPGLIFEFLVEQVDHPVLWKQSVETILNSGFKQVVEFGPGKVLNGLVKRIASQSAKSCALGSVSDTKTVKEIENFLMTAQAAQE